jgi:hypothetical protein
VTNNTERRARCGPKPLRSEELRAWLSTDGIASMSKLILLSILLLDVLVPLWAARQPNAMRGLKRTLLWMCLGNVVYLLLVMFVYPRL